MSEQPIASYSKTQQMISLRLIAECRRMYGAVVDDSTIESWVSSTLSGLLTEQTRVTQFVSVLAMRDIRELASQFVSEAA